MSLKSVLRDIGKKDPSDWPPFLQMWLREALPTIREIRRRLNDVIAAFGTATAVPNPATTVQTETAFGLASAVGTGLFYARNDHTHGSPPQPVTGLTPLDATIIVSSTTGAVSIRVGTLTSANLPADVVYDSQLSDVADMAQEMMLLLHDLVRVEMGLEPETGLV